LRPTAARHADRRETYSGQSERPAHPKEISYRLENIHVLRLCRVRGAAKAEKLASVACRTHWCPITTIPARFEEVADLFCRIFLQYGINSRPISTEF
jgi:hypothetical protein